MKNALTSVTVSVTLPSLVLIDSVYCVSNRAVAVSNSGTPKKRLCNCTSLSFGAFRGDLDLLVALHCIRSSTNMIKLDTEGIL